MKTAKTDDPGTVAACPECDEAGVYERAKTSSEDVEGVASNRSIAPDARFVCYECESGFDEYVEREPKPSPGTSHDGLHNLSPHIRKIVEAERGS